ncbi:MAG: 50S ribosomal protein L29 [Planctomycetes bacterium]|nr:50S ribosomal protein L29 [Planctomycetota bacterium]
MKIKDIRAKTDEELKAEIAKLKEELFKLRFRQVTDIVENPSLVRELKKEIARMKTVIKERSFSPPAAAEKKA